MSLPAICSAQDSLTKKEIRIQESDFLIPGNPWTVEIPLWIPGFAGEFAYGDISIEGEDGIQNPIEPGPPGSGIGDIFSRLFTTNWYLKFFYLNKVAYEQNRVKAQIDMLAGAVGRRLGWLRLETGGEETREPTRCLICGYFSFPTRGCLEDRG